MTKVKLIFRVLGIMIAFAVVYSITKLMLYSIFMVSGIDHASSNGMSALFNYLFYLWLAMNVFKEDHDNYPVDNTLYRQNVMITALMGIAGVLSVWLLWGIVENEPWDKRKKIIAGILGGLTVLLLVCTGGQQ